MGSRAWAAAVLSLALGACGRGGAGQPALRGVVEEPPARVPAVTLTDTSGAPYDLRAAARGRVTFLVFGYTSCPDVCPTNMATLAAALRGVGDDVRERVRVVFVTVDPARDTSEVLRAWLDRFNPSFVGLRGTPDQIHAAERQAGLPESAIETPPEDRGHDGAPSGYTVAHAARILVYTPDGLAHLSYLDGHTAADIRHDLAILVRGWRPRKA